MRVSVRDLKTHLSRYLAQAQAGEEIEVTSHRKVIARVSGVGQCATADLTALLRPGIAEWRGGKPAGANIRLTGSGPSLSETVMEERG
jgi:prevent-host-death family protein